VSLLTYVLSSIAWSGIGFALGLAVGRVARDDIDELPTAPPEVAERKKRRFETIQVVAVIIVVLAISTVSSSIWAAYQSRVQRECFTRVLDERSEATQRDFDSIDSMFDTLVTVAINADNPRVLRNDLRSALDAYKAQRARNDEVRDANPITPIDSC
jgi:hypothetical protein